MGINNLKVSSFLGCGAYGEVYKLDRDNCVKFMNPNIKLEPKVLEIIKNINSNGLCKLNNINLNKNGLVSSYIMEYIEKDELDILTMNSSYLLNSFNELLKICKLLSEYNILMVDIGSHNVIITKNGLKLIDFDLYEIMNFNTLEANYVLLFEMLKNLLNENITLYHSLEFFNRDFKDLFNLSYYDDCNDLIENIKYIFTKYQRPIDYLKRR